MAVLPGGIEGDRNQNQRPSLVHSELRRAKPENFQKKLRLSVEKGFPRCAGFESDPKGSRPGAWTSAWWVTIISTWVGPWRVSSDKAGLCIPTHIRCTLVHPPLHTPTPTLPLRTCAYLHTPSYTVHTHTYPLHTLCTLTPYHTTHCTPMYTLKHLCTLTAPTPTAHAIHTPTYPTAHPVCTCCTPPLYIYTYPTAQLSGAI